LLLGAVLGHLQGHLVTWFNIPPFIVTLGGMLVFQGSLLGVTGGVAISPTPDYLYIGQAYLPKMAGWGLTALLGLFFLYRTFRDSSVGRWKWLGLAALTCAFTATMNNYEGIPLPVLLLLILASIFSNVDLSTPFGRYLYAIGG